MIEPLPAQRALIDQVHDRFVAAIADGSLPPGYRITQEDVAARLGVSRQPVSHALQILRRRGLLQESGKRSLMVPPLDGRRVLHLYQVRAALEGLAARLAAYRVRAGAVTRAERTEADVMVRKGALLAEHAPVGELIAADVAFHAMLHRHSGNEAIAETVAEQWPHFMRSMGIVLHDVRVRARVWREHAEILDAVLSGDPDAAEQAARRHTERAGEEAAERLEQKQVVA